METPLEISLSMGRKEEMIAYLRIHVNYLPEAFELAVSNKQPFCWRAAWLLQNCLKKNHPLLVKFLPKLIHVLPEKNDGHQREILKLLFLVDWTEELEGELYTHCIEIWKKIYKSPSVRINAMHVLLEIGKKYPALKSEIKLLLNEDYLDSLSPGIKRSFIKQLDKIQLS